MEIFDGQCTMQTSLHCRSREDEWLWYTNMYLCVVMCIYFCIFIHVVS